MCRALVVSGLLLGIAASCAPSPSPARPATAPPAPEATAAPPGALDPMLRDFAYPYPVQYLRLRSQQQELAMAFMDVAPTAAANGRTVLLLHGKNFSGAYWARTIAALTAEGYRVVVPDQIGFGKSTKPRAFQYSFEALVEHTRALLDARGVERVAVIGHSMGGMLATRFALVHPTRTEQLVLVNPIGLEDYRAHVAPATVDALYEKELAQTPEKIRAYMRDAYFAGQWQPAYDELVTILAGWTRHPQYALVAWNAALTGDMIFTQPVVHDLPRIAVPTLLVIGQRDRTALGKDRAAPDVAAKLGHYPTLGRRARDRIPGAQLVEIDDAGHLPQVEAFDRYRAALVEFLGASTRTADR